MPPIVVVNSATKTFTRHRRIFSRGGECTRALDSVSLSVEAGSVLVLLGANGSGKTTLLKLIASTLLPDRGTIQVGRYDTRSSGREVRRLVGFAAAAERSFFIRLTARENLEFFAALEEIPGADAADRIEHLLDVVGLDDAGDKLVREFSAGMCQRLAVARALLKDPAVLLLDEPSRSLDPNAAQDLWQFVRLAARQGAAVIVASHNFEETARLADEVVVLEHGVVAGRHPIRRCVLPEDVRALSFGATHDRNAPLPHAVGART